MYVHVLILRCAIDRYNSHDPASLLLHPDLAGGGRGLPEALLCRPLLVPELVLDQVVGPDEPVAADGAGKLLVSGVRAPVAGQLVGAGEAALATRNGAAVRTLA